MYTNADATFYIYSKNGRMEKYTRTIIEGVFWDEVEQSTFLKTGQKDADSVQLVIPVESLSGNAVAFTKGKDLVIKGLVDDEIDCASQETISKSLIALKSKYSVLTVTTVDKKLYGSESMHHYELACK